jgi:phosphoribosylanthranilate isomerase
LIRPRTRVKFCGLTHADDINAAVRLGIDFVGFVFYPASPRYVTSDQAMSLRRLLPSYVQAVGLFVNEPAENLIAINKAVGLDVLQFHGDETQQECAQTFERCQIQGNTRAYWQALRLKVASDLLPWQQGHQSVVKGFEGLLLDSFSPQFGGSGHGFDWSWVVPGAATRPVRTPLIASGGLTPSNVGQAIATIQPWAVDVSSGIQSSDKRRKDNALMEIFLDQVALGDRQQIEHPT